MAASREDIRGWWMRGKGKNATHLIVVCDTFDYEDYPVFVMPGEDAREKAAECGKQEMQRVMEVYNLSMELGPQMAEHRAFNY